MTAEELQKLRDAVATAEEAATAARAEATKLAEESAQDPTNPTLKDKASEADKNAVDAEATLAQARKVLAEAEASAEVSGEAGSAGGVIELAHAPWWHYLVIGVAMGILLLGVSLTARCVFKDRAEELTGAYKLAPSNTAQPETTSGTSPTPDYRRPTSCPAGADKGTFILVQRSKIVDFGDSHRQAAIEFGSFFFANIIILAVFGFISLITLLLITKRGIANANGTLVAVFLLSSGVGLIYQGMFGVFQQKGNVDENHKQSVEYGRLVDEIDSYCATGKLAVSDPNVVLAKLAANEDSATQTETDPNAANSQTQQKKGPTFFVPVAPDDFILYIEWRTEALKKFSISLDEKPVQSLTDPSRMTGL